ncbi:MAG: peptidoglycan DD-metalloendopeptidase family protein [Dehalococcoidia bacterium]|nr:peptidoglycan DD-metalloendopeptidase family protein [Dehalococcoidia bacterium]
MGAIFCFVVAIGLFPVTVPGAPSQPVLTVSRLSLPSLAPSADRAVIPDYLEAGAQPLTVVAPAVDADALPDAADGTDARVAAIQEEQAQSAGDGVVEAARVQEDRIPIFFEYEIQEGDTVYSIAERFNVSTDYVVWNNADVITDSDLLEVGSRLQIPSVEGIIHSVRIDETVSDIADQYEANSDDIISFAANGLRNDPNLLTPDVLILVPGGVIPPPPPPPPADTIVPQPGGGGGGTGAWGWPVAGLLSSPFGPGHPLGIDLAGPVGTPVTTAQGGTVTFAGGNPCCSYGYHIIVDHGDGYETLYAHLSGFNVVSGQYVDSGDVLGWIGMTGRTTGPHVHFELRRWGAYQDPLWFLP